MLTISLIWGLVVALCCFLWLIVSIRKRQPGEPPLENGLVPYFGCALQFGANPLEFLKSRQKKYGDVFTCKIAGKFVHFVTDPFLFNAVMRHGRYFDWEKFHLAASAKAFGHGSLHPADGNTTENVHETFNKTMQGEPLVSLTSAMMENLQHTILQSIAPKANNWTSDGLYAFCYQVMFESSYFTLFGQEMNAKNDKSLARQEAQRALIRNAIENFKELDRIIPALIAGLPIHVFKSAYSARESLAKNLAQEKLRERVNLSNLVMLRMYMNDAVSTLNDAEKANTHVALLWASLGNTLPVTFWSAYYLLRCPKAMKAATEEINQVLEKTCQKVTFDDKYISLDRNRLEDMPVLDSIIKEAMRLSSASMNVRVAQENFTLKLEEKGAYAIRKDDIVAFYPQSIHLDPEIYEDPLTFKYDRFLDENGKEKTDFYLKGKKLKHYYLPFGSGKTKCPGRHFAMYEIKQLLTLLISYFEMELVDKNAQSPALVQSRAGLGILPPTHDVDFRYRLKDH